MISITASTKPEKSIFCSKTTLQSTRQIFFSKNITFFSSEKINKAQGSCFVQTAFPL
jgi:hypothetical protein